MRNNYLKPVLVLVIAAGLVGAAIYAIPSGNLPGRHSYTGAPDGWQAFEFSLATSTLNFEYPENLTARLSGPKHDSLPVFVYDRKYPPFAATVVFYAGPFENFSAFGENGALAFAAAADRWEFRKDNILLPPWGRTASGEDIYRTETSGATSTTYQYLIPSTASHKVIIVTEKYVPMEYNKAKAEGVLDEDLDFENTLEAVIKTMR